jgi:hypothetical protein
LAVQSKWWLFAGSDEGGAVTIAVRFMDGEGLWFTHVPAAPGCPLNIGRALRMAIPMYRSR